MVCSNIPLAGSSKGARHRSRYECSECKKALCIYPCFKWFHSLTVYKAECTEAFHNCRKYRLNPESKKHVQQKTRPKALDISSLEFYPLLCSSIYPSVAVHVSHNGCRRSKTKLSSVNKLIICRCQQTFQLPPVPKPIQLNKPSLQKRP